MSWCNSGLSRQLYSGYLPVAHSGRVQYFFKATETKQEIHNDKKPRSNTKPKAINQRKPVCSKTKRTTTSRKKKSETVSSHPTSNDQTADVHEAKKQKQSTQQPVNDKAKSSVTETTSAQSDITVDNFI